MTSYEIIKKWEIGELTLEEANAELKSIKSLVSIDLDKNTIKAGEEEKYGIMYDGLGSDEKVEIKDGKLVHSMGTMYVEVEYMGKLYEVTDGVTLVEKA